MDLETYYDIMVRLSILKGELYFLNENRVDYEDEWCEGILLKAETLYDICEDESKYSFADLYGVLETYLYGCICDGSKNALYEHINDVIRISLDYYNERIADNV